MDRSQKADLVAELKDVFTETSVVVVTRNLGLSVAQSTDLRLKMRDAGAQFKVAKNRLALIALEGTKYGPIGDMLIDVAGIKALAELPSLDQLRGTLVGLIQAPATKIARIVSEPGAMIARVTGAYAAKAA